METLEDKQLQLDAFGIVLTFPTFSIKAINGEDYSLINFEVDSVSHNTAEYYFQVTQEDWFNFEIAMNDSFTTTIVNKVFHWKIYKKPEPDVYGWVKLTANLVRIV